MSDSVRYCAISVVFEWTLMLSVIEECQVLSQQTMAPWEPIRDWRSQNSPVRCRVQIRLFVSDTGRSMTRPEEQAERRHTQSISKMFGIFEDAVIECIFRSQPVGDGSAPHLWYRKPHRIHVQLKHEMPNTPRWKI